ncbi:MAG: hypothetical protein JWL90_4500 [Chthoniobacteraceae bacterium]|nr:hypothetical protein [Chthoniobacteraceae bacterium]
MCERNGSSMRGGMEADAVERGAPLNMEVNRFSSSEIRGFPLFRVCREKTNGLGENEEKRSVALVQQNARDQVTRSISPK